jgi:hypothetical protein
MPDSLNLLDSSGIFKSADASPPEIISLSIDEIQSGDVLVTLRAQVQEEPGSGIKWIEWELWNATRNIQIGLKRELLPEQPLSVDRSYSFDIPPAKGGELYTAYFRAANLSDYESSRTASTTVLVINTLNLLDSEGTFLIGDGVPPYIEIHALTGVTKDSVSVTVEATIYDVDEYGYRTDTLKQIRLVLKVTGQPEQGITEQVGYERAWGYDRGQWTFTVEPLRKSDEVTITIYAEDVGGFGSTASLTEHVPGLLTTNLLDSTGYFQIPRDTTAPTIFRPAVVQDLQGTLAGRGAEKIGLQAWLSDTVDDGSPGSLRWARFSLYIIGFDYYEQAEEWVDIFKADDFFRTTLWEISLLTGGEKTVLEGGEEIRWRIEVEDVERNLTVQEGIHLIEAPPPPPPPDILEYWEILQPFAGDQEVRIEFKLRQEAEVGVFLGIDEPVSLRLKERQRAGLHFISIQTPLLEVGQTVFVNLEINGVPQIERSKIVLSLPVRPFVRGYGWAFSFGFGE